MREKISVIVPVYNGQDYIERCLQSIINQTYKNLEIIIVDDGSEDNSLNIINKIKATEDRLIIINNKHSGVSAARNSGIENATGDWIIFVDGDDTLEKNAIENLSCSISEKIDIVLSKNYEIRDGKKKSYIWKYDKNMVFDKSEKLIRTIFYENKNGEMNYIRNPFSKLYRKRLLENNNIRFPKKIIVRRRCYF